MTAEQAMTAIKFPVEQDNNKSPVTGGFIVL